jgi:hypothetical protein
MAERLRELLQTADAEFAPPLTPACQLVTGVQRELLLRHSGPSRLVGGAAALLLLTAGSAALWIGHAASGDLDAGTPIETAERGAPRDATMLQAEIRALHAEADARRAVAHRLAALQARDARVAAWHREAARPTPVELAGREASAAAGTLIRQADQLYFTLQNKGTAAATYRQVLDVFPGSPWADVARARLAALARQTEGESS